MDRPSAYQGQNAPCNASGVDPQHPNYYNYNYLMSSALNQYQHQHFSICDQPEQSQKSMLFPSSSCSNSFLTEPLTMDYVNFKKYMDPTLSNRTPTPLYHGYEDTSRLSLPQNSLPSRPMFFPPLQEQEPRFGYPQTPEVDHFPSLSHPLFPPITPGIPDIYGHEKQTPEDFHQSYGSMYSAVDQQPGEYCRPEAIIRVVTSLHQKYWRNGRRNLQCFPNCQAYGDYSLIRLEDFKAHDFMWGKCRGRVEIEVSLLNIDAFVDDVVILGRIHSLDNITSRFAEDVNLESMAGKTVKLKEMEEMRDSWITGERNTDRPGLKSAGFAFKPKVWKYVDNENPGKCKRRHIKYYVQFEAFILIEDMGQRCYLGIGSGASTPFEVGSSRVLARQKRKAASKSGAESLDSTEEDVTHSVTQDPEADVSESHIAEMNMSLGENGSNVLQHFLSTPLENSVLQKELDHYSSSDPHPVPAASR
ncbi:unnamed protein product [Albugo candida]|uniref:NDT80 domain-containing protein n=1 Tax=Albugo candida TaxID=65357 RepID=A0A024G2E0_9STRA|nr:unnamed protein product [Albugo candida]|eukprot:CCI40910.1 unnamed protein product [Albugo candida]